LNLEGAVILHGVLKGLLDQDLKIGVGDTSYYDNDQP